MEVTGKIIHKLAPAGGTSKAGNAWSKQEYVLETIENFPKKIFFDFFGERANQYPLEVGQTVTLSFDIESREYNGRWYTSIRGWKAEQVDAAQATAPSATAPMASPVPSAVPAPPMPDFSSSAGENDDLPF